MIQRHIVKLMALLFILPVMFACSKPQVVTISPEKPTAGGEITIQYNPAAEGAVLADTGTVDVQLLLYRAGETPLLVESALSKTAKGLETKISLDAPKANYGMAKFVSGEREDTNGDMFWDFFIHDEAGIPLEGAHLSRAKSFRRSMRNFKREKDLTVAAADVAAEESLHPGQLDTRIESWWITWTQSKDDSAAMSAIEMELDSIALAHPDNDSLRWRLTGWYDRVGNEERGDKLENILIAYGPKTDIARTIRYQRIYEPSDPNERARWASVFLKDYPDATGAQKAGVARIMMRAKQHRRAEEVAISIQPPDGQLLNSLAWGYIEKEIGVARGTELARMGVDALRNRPESDKPSYWTNAQWEERKKYDLGMVLDTYGFGLYKLARYKEAQAAYREAYDLMDGARAEVNERLLRCYLKNKDYATAVEVARECIENSHYNDKVLKYGKKAFVGHEGSAEGFDEMLAAANARAMEKMAEEAATHRIDKPAPDFEAKDLSGEVVRLSALQGKVVVLDFWATWCGPCRQAFPYVQKVYEKYQDNPDVVILAVNTWEKVGGEALVTKVRKFISKSKYTFPVVFDESKVVEQYKVEGIPTQFIIGRDGRVAFKDVGFPGPKLEQAMIVKIDMLLAEVAAAPD